LADCQTLSELLNISSTENFVLISPLSIKYNLVCLKNEKKYCTSYSDALAKCVFSKVIVSKLSRSGLGLPHLKLVFERSGADGLEKIIKSRIGSSKVNITKVIAYLTSDKENLL